jgi:hypothetical protein
MMYDVSMSLQHTDFAHAADFPHSLEKLEHLVEVFDAHAGHEDGHIFTLLQSCNSALQDEMEKEHVTDIALSHELRALIAQYKSAANAEEKRALGNKICYTYYEYMAFNLKHMNKEEIVVNESLWNHYTDQDIVKANMTMVAQLSPEEVRRNAVWMMRGCSNTDIIGWLGVVKKQVPEPVFNNLMTMAEAELPAQRFEAVQNALMEVA